MEKYQGQRETTKIPEAPRFYKKSDTLFFTQDLTQASIPYSAISQKYYFTSRM